MILSSKFYLALIFSFLISILMFSNNCSHFINRPLIFDFLNESELEPSESPFGGLPFFSFKKSMRSYTDKISPIDFDFEYTNDLGFKIGRAHYLTWNIVQPTHQHVINERFDWADSDEVLGSYPAGIKVVENIICFSPMVDDLGEHLLDFQFQSSEEEEAYVRFVLKGVERYDGDGVDDMPALRNPIKYWQVDNEPSAKTQDWKGYSHLLDITYKAIKKSCEDCKVIMGGVPYGGPGSIKNHLEGFYKPAIDLLTSQAFDIFDFHCYVRKSEFASECGEAVQLIREFIKGDYDIWATEVGTYSGTPKSFDKEMNFQSEGDQAEGLIKLFVNLFSKNVKKIFWAWGIMEGFGGPENNIFDHTGLIYDGYGSEDLGFGIKKLSYFSLKKMIELLDNPSWSKIEVLSEKDDIFIYKFYKRDSIITILWCESENTKLAHLTDIKSSQVQIIQAIPRAETGLEIKSYEEAFFQYHLNVTDHEVNIEITHTPIYVIERVE